MAEAELDQEQAQFIKEAREEFERAREEGAVKVGRMKDKTEFPIGVATPGENDADT
jgi:hypothetical protein